MASHRNLWDATAQDRGKWNEKTTLWTKASTEAMVEAAGIRPGMHVLDVAAGVGDPALTLARIVGPAGHVTATDISAEMLAEAEENARKQGLKNVTFRQADAASLPFPEQAFDAVTCRFGVMYFPDLGRALREIYRVLRPRGRSRGSEPARERWRAPASAARWFSRRQPGCGSARAVFVAWGQAWEQNPLFACTLGPLFRCQPLPPESKALLLSRFIETGKLRRTLEEAGFAEVREEIRDLPWFWPGAPEELWECYRVRSAPFRTVFGGLPGESQEKIRDEILAGFGRYAGSGQVNLRALIVLAWGERPAQAAP